jgi:hypothetical protein
MSHREHASEVRMPVPVLYVPALHLLQTTAFIAEEYVPAAHFSQFFAGEVKVPASQASHAVPEPSP